MEKTNTIERQNGFDQRDIDFYYLIGVFFKYKKIIISITFITAVISIVYALLATPYYISRTSMYPVNKEEGGILKELSQTLGISNKTKGYYIFDVLKSKRISSEVIYSKYLPSNAKDSVNLLEFWNLNKLDISENRKLETAIILLNSSVNMHEDKETSLITISAITKDKLLSKDIVQRYCDATIKYLNVTQQTSTKKSVAFAQNRLQAVTKELAQIQDDVVRFQTENSLINSPNLSMEIKKKIEKMDLLKSVVVLLGKELELLKIEEVKENQIINILDQPDVVDKPVKPQKRLIVIVNTFLSFLITYVGVILHEKAKKYGVYRMLKIELVR